jgi:regulator of extracellular matrix RemA (YlzA/DUF370 family)
VVAVIALIVVGIAFIVVAALVVGIVDRTRAPALRRLAAERRKEWEERVLELHGGVEPAAQDDWDDD